MSLTFKPKKVMLHKMNMTMGRKEIQRCRTMRFFIDAAIDVIEQEGTDGLTIRKVADLAGFNSATLYNYFESLDHLVYYTHMRYVKPLADQLKINVKDESEMDVRTLWREYCIWAYEHPVITYDLLFSPHASDFKTILSDYITIYSDAFDGHTVVKLTGQFKESLFYPMDEALWKYGEGQILLDNEIDDLKRIMITYFQGALVRQIGLERMTDKKQFLDQMLLFIDHLQKIYRIPFVS